MRLLEFFPAGSVGPHRLSRTRGLAVPPPAAQRLEQRGRVRVARRLRLHERELRERVLALRVEKLDVVHRAELELLLRDLEAFARSCLGLGLRLERRCVVLQREQYVGDVLERGEDCLAVLGEGLVVRRLGSALPRPELTRVEDRLEEIRAEVPQLSPRIEKVSGA